MAAAPGMNALVADLDEKSKHLGDFCLSFEKIPSGGTLLLADSYGENAGISQRKDIFIGFVVSHVESRATVKSTHVLQQRRPLVRRRRRHHVDDGFSKDNARRRRQFGNDPRDKRPRLVSLIDGSIME